MAKGVVRTNNPAILKEFGGTAELTNQWARSARSDLNWSKQKETTSKIEPTPQFLAEEKFTLQRAVSSHDIPYFLLLNVDQTPLSLVFPGQCTFSF